MSRVGKQEIKIPAGVELKQDGSTITIKGPLGTLTRDFTGEVAIKIDGDLVTLEPARQTKFLRSLWGTYASHLQNMIEGVTKGYEKKMTIEGVGYKVNVQGNKVVLDIGLSHSVQLEIPEGVKMTVEKNNFAVSGIDKELVGQFAATIRDHKRVEPYKGKGIRYVGEVVLRKQGKKSTA
jgi:large subunit ribosomal protein L6